MSRRRRLGRRDGVGWRCAIAGCSAEQDVLDLLSIGATAVHVGVGEPGAPFHDTAEIRIGCRVDYDLCQLRRCCVVYFASRASVGTQRCGRHSDEELGILGVAFGDERGPVVVVEGSVAVDAEGTRYGVVVIVVELNPQVVELRVADDDAHVGFRDGALRSTGDVILLGRVLGKIAAKGRDEVLVILVPVGVLDIKVPAIDDSGTQGPRDTRVARVAVGVPEILADGLGLGLRSQGVAADAAAKREHNLHARFLTGCNLRDEGIAARRAAIGANGALDTNSTTGDGVSVAKFIEEGQDNDINASFRSAVGGKIRVFDSTAAVLAIVDNVETTGARSGLKRVTRISGSADREACKAKSCKERRELHDEGVSWKEGLVKEVVYIICTVKVIATSS